jgi:Domain of unknown function (DUF4406)
MRIYIASPYTQGEPLANVRRQIDAAEQLAAKGHVPILPLLSHFWDDVYHHPWEFWIEQCLSHLVTADAVMRLPGVSVGADIEVREARNIGLPVYFWLDDVPDGDVVANDN